MRLQRAGAWLLLGDPRAFAEQRPALERLCREQRKDRGLRRLGPVETYFKGSPLSPRAGLRHALRNLLGLSYPRLNEFENLEWLRLHGFLAPRPVLAGVCRTATLPRYQFLFSEHLPDCAPLTEVFPTLTPPTRARVLESLARDLAALHALGFVHRDLFPRNLLVGRAEPARTHFLDAWRGGPRPGWRGPEHDLACLMLDDLLTREEQGSFFTTYGEERAHKGLSLPSDWPKRVERARRALFRREDQRHPGLRQSWRFPIWSGQSRAGGN